MASGTEVGLRILVLGKDGAVASVRAMTAAVAQMNDTTRAGAAASKEAAAASDVQMAGLVKLQATMDLYQDNLARVNVETDALAKVGKVAFLGLTAAAAAWGYESIKWATQYQTALVQLRTQAGLTVTQMNAIGAAAKKNAASLGISPTAYVTAAYHPASAGFGKTTVRESIAITNNAAKLAAIGGSPVETTTNALTGVMKAYGYKPSQTTSTAAKLNAIIGAGNMHASTLVAALGSGVASTAKTFGVSLSSLGGALAFMTDRGVPAAQAGTHLRMTLSLLGAPSAKAATLLKTAGLTTSKILSSTNSMSQMLQEAGVTSTQMSRALRTNKGKGGIYNALDLLHKTLTAAGLTKQMQGAMISRSFGGGRMGSTIEMMYNSVSNLGSKTTKITKNSSISKFMKDWTAETKTLDFQLKHLGATLETLGTEFGTVLIPPLTDALKLFTDLVGWLGKNKAVALALGGALSAVLIPAIGVYLKRALLSANGSIMTVVGGYKRLILGQSEEQASLARTDASLAANDAALASNDAAAATNDVAHGGGSGGGGAMSILSNMFGSGGSAYMTYKLFRSRFGGVGTGDDVAAVGEDGASLSSLLGIGAGAAAAVAGLLYLDTTFNGGAKTPALVNHVSAKRAHQLAQAATALHKDYGDRGIKVPKLTGLATTAKEYATQIGTKTLLNAAVAARKNETPVVHVHNYMTGREITKTVIKHTKKNGGLTG